MKTYHSSRREHHCAQLGRTYQVNVEYMKLADWRAVVSCDQSNDSPQCRQCLQNLQQELDFQSHDPASPQANL